MTDPRDKEAATRPTFSDIEVELFSDALHSGANCTWAPEVGAYGVAMHDLIVRGLFRKNLVGDYSVTTEGGRQAVAAGVVTFAQLATKCDAILARLTNHAAAVDSGLADRSICDGWDVISDDPHSRASAAVLQRRHMIQTRQRDGRLEGRPA